MSVKVMLVRTGVFETVPCKLDNRQQELEDQKVRGKIETIQTTPLLKSAGILRKMRET